MPSFVFPLFFASLLLAAHLAVGISLTHLFSLRKRGKRLVTALFTLMYLVSVLGLPLMRFLPRETASLFGWFFYPWIGCFLTLLLPLALADILALGTRLLTPKHLDPSRRTALKKIIGLTAIGTSASLAAFSFKNGLSLPLVKPVTITLPRLPVAFDSLRLVQLSDLHIGAMQNGAWLQKIVATTNAQNPDLIVLTGDLVDGSVANLAADVAPLADLHAPLGVYFVTGNHDYYSGAEAWCAHIESLGIRTLRNAHTMLTRQNDSLFLAGIEDAQAPAFGTASDLDQALSGIPPHAPVILLAHQPISVFNAAAHHVDLQLSGHTHGGQIWPFHYIVLGQQPYLSGLHQHSASTQIYVSRGTGNWGPPMRLGAPSEITLITLKKKFKTRRPMSASRAKSVASR